VDSESPFEIKYDNDEECFVFSMFGRQMIGSRITARIGKAKARVTEIRSRNGQDIYGDYDEFNLHFVSPKNENKRFVGNIRSYEGFVIFDLCAEFEIKGKKNKNLFGNPYISFPCFEGEFKDEGCTMLSFKRQMPFNYPVMWTGKVTDSFRDGKNVPLLIADQSCKTILLSPLTNLLYGTVSISSYPQAVRCGIPRAVKTIPAGSVQKTLMVYGQGINATIDRWGEIMRGQYSVEAIKMDADVSLKYISYWTNAGSAYWYNTYKKKDYESTLRELRTHHESVGLCFGSYQLDSWWYKKDGDSYTSGIMEWAPKFVTRCKNFNSVLPFLQRYRELPLFARDKLSYVQSIINKPIGCHFKQLSNESVYVLENIDDFTCEDFPMPKNKEAAKRLFRELLIHPKWRLAFIVHDWLQWMNDRHSAFKDYFSGPEYFEALDEVCMEISNADNSCGHLTVQLCMTQPHMTLNSVAMESVTSIRSTSDSYSFFVEGTKRWWWHLYSSRFIQALGKFAFYDNRLTSKIHTHPLSSWPQLEMIWLGLSCGPIGIGDPIGKENIELIRRAVKNDGEIIKPDFAAVPLDRCYLYNPYTLHSERGITVYSHSEIGESETNKYTIRYLLTFNVHPLERKVHMEFKLTEAGADEDHMYVLYDYFSGEFRVVSALFLNCFVVRRRKFYYNIAAPIERGLAFLGNAAKHVTCSRQLVRKIIFTDYGMSVEVYSEIENVRSESMVLKKHRKRKTETTPVWIFYCRKEPKEVILDEKNMEICWKDGILKIIDDTSETQNNKESKIIKVII
jgi:hypothetical protein